MVEEDPTTQGLGSSRLEGTSAIITCLEYIREYLMEEIVNVQKVQDKCDGPLKHIGQQFKSCKSRKRGGTTTTGVAVHGDAAHGSQQAWIHVHKATQSKPQAC
ncbi:hypothetical protein Tco_0624638 [Tanacetum coccineum]|uniref:Uncharacterized protein n=1 Tax=Tanacetum coccineum TaxID=301880 RepID=A0ABQ4WEI1_9ASTR